MGDRTSCYGDEELEDGALGVVVADGGRDGGEPLVGVSEPPILDDLAVVERAADEERAEERRCRDIVSTRGLQRDNCAIGGALRSMGSSTRPSRVPSRA